MKTFKTILLITAILFAFSFTNKEINKKTELNIVTDNLSNTTGYSMIRIFYEPGTNESDISQYRNHWSTKLDIVDFKTCIGLDSYDYWLVTNESIINFDSSGFDLGDPITGTASSGDGAEDLDLKSEEIKRLIRYSNNIPFVFISNYATINSLSNITCLSIGLD